MLKQHSDIFLSMVFTAILFMVFPIILLFVNQIMNWTGESLTLGNFTGMESIVGIAPLILFVGAVFGNLMLTTYSGIKASKEKLGTAVIIGVIMIGVGLVFYTLVLNGAEALLTDTYIDSYVGMSAIVGISPLLIFVMYIFGAIAVVGVSARSKIKGG